MKQQEDINGEAKKRGRPRGSYKKQLTLIEIDQFIQDSIDMLIRKHMSHKQYIRFCRTKDLSYNQCNKYYVRTWDFIKERFNLERNKLVDKHLITLWELYDKSIENNEFNTSRQILSDIAKLQGLNEPDKIQVDNHIIELKFNGPDTSSGVYSDGEAI